MYEEKKFSYTLLSGDLTCSYLCIRTIIVRVLNVVLFHLLANRSEDHKNRSHYEDFTCTPV